jgi:hypothetical protein
VRATAHHSASVHEPCGPPGVHCMLLTVEPTPVACAAVRRMPLTVSQL